MSQISGRPWWIVLLGMSVAQTSQAAPGEGINLGQVTVSPSIQLNVSYDSNVKHWSPDLATQYGFDSPPDSAFLEVRPALKLSYGRDNDVFKFQASYEAPGRLYTQDVQGSEALNDISYIDHLLNLEANILPQGRFGVTVKDDFRLNHFPARDTLTGALSRTYNQASIEGRFSPGSALDLMLGFRYLLDEQEVPLYAVTSTDEGAVAPLTKYEPAVELRARWRFFPRTSLLAEFEFAPGRWDVSECTAVALCANKSESVTQWTGQAGVAGQFTTTLQAALFLGYGNLYNTTGDVAGENVTGLDGVIGQLQLVYLPMDTQSISAGFVRRFGDSATQDYAIYNTFSMGYNGTYFGKLNTSAGLGFDLRMQNSADPTNQYTRTDQIVSGMLGAEYQITPWLTTKASLASDFVVTRPNDLTGGGQTDASLSQLFEYNQVVLSLGVRGVY